MPVFSINSECDGLRRVLTIRPEEALQTQTLIEVNWAKAAWTAEPEFNATVAEHFRFMRLLRHRGAAINYHEDEWIVSPNFMLVRDAALMSPIGFVQAAYQDQSRAPELTSIADYLDQLGVTKLGEIEGSGIFCASDAIWIKSDLLCVAITCQTNQEAVNQIRALFQKFRALDGIEILELNLKAPSSTWETKIRSTLAECLAPISTSEVVIFEDRFDEISLQELNKKGITTIPITEDEYMSFGCSIVFINNFEACIPDTSKLDRIKKLLEKRHITTLPVTFEHLAYSRAGLQSFILPLLRD